MLIETKSLSKKFGNMFALTDIDFSVSSGEIHGLVGENGAGKSTLIKILTGVYPITSGEIYWNNEKVELTNPKKSREIGINVIHQDRNLIPSFTGIENVYLGLDYEKKLGFAIDYKMMRKKVEDIMEELNISVPLDVPASKLTPPQKTLLEIIRAVMTKCKLLILDEPTASLTDKETTILFKLINRLKNANTSIVYVTHRMDEIFQLTDRITILRNGKKIDTVNTSEVNKDKLVSLMSGDFESFSNVKHTTFGNEVLKLKDLKSNDGKVLSASMTVKSGEILGIFGLGGSGRTELLECIYGLRASTGEITVSNSIYEKRNPYNSIKKGIVLINEDRRGKALIVSLSVKKNTLLTTIDKYTKFGIVNSQKESVDSNKKILELNIKTTGENQAVKELSGGNQQKVVFAKALMSQPDIFLCDEPTQAVDVKTRAEIHRLLRQKADNGSAIVFVSSDLKEVLDISDNILIMSQGRTKQQFVNSGLKAEALLKCCYGS